jgi:hypothetical protein
MRSVGRLLRRHCEERSDEAIHSFLRGEMDCFASLAMTVRHTLAFSRREAPEVCMNFRPSKTEGAGKAGCPLHPQPRVQSEKAHERSHYRSTGTSPGLPCAMVLTVSFVLSPATGLSCHRRPRKLPSANLTPASGRQDHTTSPSASSAVRPQHHPRPPHPVPNVRDDREAPLLRDGMARVVDLICPTAKAKYFSQRGWTGTKQRNEVICPSGRFLAFLPSKIESFVARHADNATLTDSWSRKRVGLNFALYSNKLRAFETHQRDRQSPLHSASPSRRADYRLLCSSSSSCHTASSGIQMYTAFNM